MDGVHVIFVLETEVVKGSFKVRDVNCRLPRHFCQLVSYVLVFALKVRTRRTFLTQRLAELIELDIQKT